MSTRQARMRSIILGSLLAFITACSSSITPTASATPSRTLTPFTSTPSYTPEPTLTPSPELTATQKTPLACLKEPGAVEEGILETTKPPQEYFVYLPPCYSEKADKRYPVLYLLHGQTYRADQWIRLGAVQTIDRLIVSGEVLPFILVFPDDRYWNQPSGTSFGNRVVNDLLPYIDLTYRTMPDPRYRAIGGLSRGAGWALRLGLSRPDLFTIIGLHSPAVFQNDASKIDDWILAIPPASHPQVFIDIGEDDRELDSVQQIEELFTNFDLPHEWHLYTGSHTEEYWSSHVEEYIRWYAEQWSN